LKQVLSPAKSDFRGTHRPAHHALTQEEARQVAFLPFFATPHAQIKDSCALNDAYAMHCANLKDLFGDSAPLFDGSLAPQSLPGYLNR
jgi:hypothetical protein